MATKDEASALRRWRAGHELAAARKRQLLTAEGPQPAQAVAESNTVRSKPGRAESGLEDALAALARGLDAAHAPWMVIGGIAIIARGVRRMTTDIDAVVRGDAVEVRTIVRALENVKIISSVPVRSRVRSSECRPRPR